MEGDMTAMIDTTASCHQHGQSGGNYTRIAFILRTQLSADPEADGALRAGADLKCAASLL